MLTMLVIISLWLLKYITISASVWDLGRYRANIPCSLVTCYITIFNRKFYLPTQVPPTYSIIIKCDSHYFMTML